MFFNYYPVLEHLDENGKAIIVRNIMRRADVSASIKNGNNLYLEYDVRDGETPEELAERMYGGADKHWLIMLMNDVGLLYCDWVKPYERVVREAKYKYGEAELYNTHHYEDLQGNIVHPEEVTPDISVSNLDYEIAENEKKRRIKVLNSAYAGVAELEIKTILKD